MSINPSDLINHIMPTPQTGQLVRVVNESGAEFFIPVTYFQTAASGVDGVTGSGNITVNNDDLQNPIVGISATPSFTTVTATTSMTTATFATSGVSANVTLSNNVLGAGGTDAAVGIIYNTKSTGSHSFYTNSTERWTINGSGSLNPASDNSYDIGNLSVNPRDIHATRSLIKKGLAAEGYASLSVLSATASTTFTGGATETIAVQIPAGAEIIGTAWRIDVDIVLGGGGVNFDLNYTGGATQAIVTNEATLTKNNKNNAPFNVNAATNITSATTDIVVTPDAGTIDSGAITCVTFYRAIANLTDAA
jgi:hypothetical protein